MNLIKILICNLVIFSLFATFVIPQQNPQNNQYLLEEVSDDIIEYSCGGCSFSSVPALSNPLGGGFYNLNLGDGLSIRILLDDPEIYSPAKVYSCDAPRGCTLEIKYNGRVKHSFRVEKSKLVFGGHSDLMYIVPYAKNNAPFEIIDKIHFVNAGDIISFYKGGESVFDEEDPGDYFGLFNYIRGNAFSIADRDITITNENGGDISQPILRGTRKPLILCGKYFFDTITERTSNYRRDRISSIEVKDKFEISGTNRFVKCYIPSYQISTAGDFDPTTSYSICNDMNSEIHLEYDRGKLTNYKCQLGRRDYITLSCAGNQLCKTQTSDVIIDLHNSNDINFIFHSGEAMSLFDDGTIVYYNTNFQDNSKNLILRKYFSTIFEIVPDRRFTLWSGPVSESGIPNSYSAIITSDEAIGRNGLTVPYSDLHLKSGIIREYKSNELKRTINLLIPDLDNLDSNLDSIYIIRFSGDRITQIKSSSSNSRLQPSLANINLIDLFGVSLLQTRPYIPNVFYLQQSTGIAELSGLSSDNEIINPQGNSFRSRPGSELFF